MDERIILDADGNKVYPRIITRMQYENCKYNTKLIVPGNHEVVVISKNGIRRIKKIEKPILNRKFLALFKRIDPNIYTVFYLNKAIYEGIWKGKISRNQRTIPLLIQYSFSIIRGDKFVPYISDVKDAYASSYVMKKMNGKISALIKQCIYQQLAKRDVEDLEKNLYTISQMIQKKLNREILAPMGIRLTNFDVSFEESEQEKESTSKGRK